MSRLNYNKGRLSDQIRNQERDSRLKRSSKMRKKAATPAQSTLMKKLNIEIPKGCSIEKACYLIGRILNKY